MSKQVDLACTVCAEEFPVPIDVYSAYSGIVPCPRCGSTDLVLLGERYVASERSVVPIGCLDKEPGTKGVGTEARAPRLTLEEVLETERHAWAASNMVGRCISFDGIEFWVSVDQRPLRVALKSEIPWSGWWHKDSCNCRLCRGTRDAEEHPSGTSESRICA